MPFGDVAVWSPQRGPEGGCTGGCARGPVSAGRTWWGPGGPWMSGEVVQRLGGSRSSPSSSENGPWRELGAAFALGADSGGIGSVSSLAFLQTLSCAAVLSISSPLPILWAAGR